LNKQVTSATEKGNSFAVAAPRNWIAIGSEVVGQTNRIPVSVHVRNIKQPVQQACVAGKLV
jgi:hypothetical protein